MKDNKTNKTNPNTSKDDNSEHCPSKFDMNPGDGMFFKNEAELEEYLKANEPNRKLAN